MNKLVKNNWLQKPFEDCIEDITYTPKIQRSSFLSEGKYPIISQESNFINGYWDNANDLFQVESPIIVFGDHTQVIKYIDFSFVLGADGVKILKPKPFLYPKYLYYLLKGTSIRNLGYARHYKLLKEKVLNYPESIEEQKRIVSILDSVFNDTEKAIAISENNLSNVKELFETYLEKIYTSQGKDWKNENIINICKKITDGSHFSPKSSEVGEYPYITVRDISNDRIDFDNCKFINKKDYDLLVNNDCNPQKGDVLFSKDGTVGKVSLVETDRPFVVLSSLAIIRPNQKIINSLFLKYILKSRYFLTTAIGKKTGTAIKRIILKNLKNIIISYPESLTEQMNIASDLDNLYKETQQLEIVYKQKIQKFITLKQSVLNKAFKGEL